MVASQENKTRMVDPVKSPRHGWEGPVKIKAIHPITYQGLHMTPGQEASVSEEMAAEFCDRKFKGNYEFSGERETGVDTKRASTSRAVRL